MQQMMAWFDHEPDDARDDIQCSSLQLAIDHQKLKEVIFRMMDIGGMELMMMNDQYGKTALHWACENENISMEIISKMLEMGGRELLMMDDQFGISALHCACENKNISMEMILEQLLEVGGRELLIINDYEVQT